MACESARDSRSTGLIMFTQILFFRPAQRSRLRTNTRNPLGMEAIIKSRVVGDAMPQCRSEFEAIFREKREKGAQLCCMVNGKVVVDLAGGRSAAEVFDFDRVARVYSNSKSVEALVIAMLEDRGLIKYSDSVGKLLGPDFAHLDALTVAGLMRHRGGSSCIDKKVSFEDARRIFASAAETKAWMRDSLARDFDPSRPTATTYHAITRGMFVAVIVHQLTGVEYYDFVKREILAKLGAVDFYLGDSPKDKQEPLEIAYDVKDHLWEYVLHKSGYVRWFHTPSAKAGKAAMEKHMWDWRSEGELDEIMAFITPSSVTHRSFNLLSKDRPLNAYWATALASTDGHSNARSMATIFNGASLLRSEQKTNCGARAARLLIYI